MNGLGVELDIDLISRYPTGYHFVSYNDDSTFAASTSRLLTDYYFDWDKIELEKDETGEFIFSIGEFVYIPSDLVFKTKMSTPFNWNKVGDILLFEMFILKDMKDNMYVEVIDVSKLGVIFCFGFRDKKLPELEHVNYIP